MTTSPTPTRLRPSVLQTGFQGISACFFCVLMLSACSKPETEVVHAPPVVKVVTVEQGLLQRDFRVSGVVRPVARAQLAFQTDGVVLERLVELGDQVSAGQLLAVVRNPRLQPEAAAALATVSEIRARRDQAQRDLKRLRQLRIDNAVGEERVEQKEADLRALSASLQRAQAQLEALSSLVAEASLKAPFDGEISEILAEPGEYVRPGQAVMVMGDPELLEVQVQIPAAYANLETGASVPVDVPLLDQTLNGQVDRISRLGQANTGLFPAIITLGQRPGLRAGLRADVLVPWQSDHEALIVPLTAVVDPVGGQPRLYRVVNGKVQQISVAVGEHQGHQITVENTASAASGDLALNVGDQVVVTGHQSLTDGQTVQVLP